MRRILLGVLVLAAVAASARTPAPAAPVISPEAPVLTGEAGTTTATLQWTPGASTLEVWSYRVRQTNPDGSIEYTMVDGDTTTHTASGLASGSTYRFAVMAFTQFSQSDWSNEVALTPVAPEEPPAPCEGWTDRYSSSEANVAGAPQNLRVQVDCRADDQGTPSTLSFRLTWDPASKQSHPRAYRIYREIGCADCSATKWQMDEVGPGHTEYIRRDDLSQNTHYFFWVAAVMRDGTVSPLSNTASVHAPCFSVTC